MVKSFENMLTMACDCAKINLLIEVEYIRNFIKFRKFKKDYKKFQKCVDKEIMMC